MRKIISLEENWIFKKHPEDVGEAVNLPHTWNAADGQDGGDDYYRGRCTYAREFACPPLEVGDQVYLECDGVANSAEVFLNGKEIGRHDGGFSAFRMNLTEALQENNLLVIAADNSVNDRVYPQKADFTFYGGIYRAVKLVVIPGLHFQMENYGAPGIKITPVLMEDKAEVTVDCWLEKAGNREGRAEGSRCRLESAPGSGEATAPICLRIALEGEHAPEALYLPLSPESGHVSVTLTIPQPHLWQGRRDPYLYRARAELVKVGAETADVLDAVCLRFGLRTFAVDPEKGFFLNGEAYPLRGVSRHQDREGVGNALTRTMQEEDMKLIAEVGANSIRLAHYQHDQFFYDLCDACGMVVWAEIPYITRHMENGRENTLQQMRELILQNHHHASICFWGISNEISAGGLEGTVAENNRELAALAKELDPDRLSTMACAFMLDDGSELLSIPDVVAYNHYFGWYLGDLEDNEAWFDKFHGAHPDLAVGLSEYGAEAVLKWQTARPERGDYTEQYQAVYHEHMLRMIEERPYLWCTYVWNMFDFAADGRDEGGVKGRNNKGLVTFDRRTRKDAFYLYKAHWSDEPFVHIAGRRYVNRSERLSDVKIYSNQKNVELYQNGRLIAPYEPEGLTAEPAGAGLAAAGNPAGEGLAATGNPAGVGLTAAWNPAGEGLAATGNPTGVGLAAARKGDPHIFRYRIELEEENELVARAGEAEDRILVRHVAAPDPSYVMPSAGEVTNWLDGVETERKEGYFSLEDKVGELIKSPEGEKVFLEFLAVYDSRKKGAAASVKMSMEQRLMTMKSMKLGEFARRTNTPREEVAAWAGKLQEIRKPE